MPIEERKQTVAKKQHNFLLENREKMSITGVLDVDIFNPDKQEELFAWMVEQFDAMKRALSYVGEIG